MPILPGRGWSLVDLDDLEVVNLALVVGAGQSSASKLLQQSDFGYVALTHSAADHGGTERGICAGFERNGYRIWVFGEIHLSQKIAALRHKASDKIDPDRLVVGCNDKH